MSEPTNTPNIDSATDDTNKLWLITGASSGLGGPHGRGSQHRRHCRRLQPEDGRPRRGGGSGSEPHYAPGL
jgi:hypothetical protein